MTVLIRLLARRAGEYIGSGAIYFAVKNYSVKSFIPYT